jgi:hypothetical protein
LVILLFCFKYLTTTSPSSITVVSISSFLLIDTSFTKPFLSNHERVFLFLYIWMQ